jgi:thiamine-phosphate pyrophosphorylase
MTDERLGGEDRNDPLWRAIGRLPRGAGIVFRHYGWDARRRLALARRLVATARKRGLVLVTSGSALPGASGIHRSSHVGRRRLRAALVTAAAHGRAEIVRAFAQGADLVFLSPVFPTSSHPEAPSLGPVRFGLLARGHRGPVIALGGMDNRRARRMKALGAAGFAAVGWWARP